MRKDVADFWIFLWEVGVGLCAVFFLLNAFAPPQDLFWKPLDLNRPVGRATAAQVSDFEVRADDSPEAAEGVTRACIDALRAAGVEVERRPDKDDGGFCAARGVVRLTGGDVTPLSPGGLEMRCPLLVRYVIWDRQTLRPEARRHFGAEPARVENLGSYSCRRIYGSTNATDRPSEHARANALDISGVVLSDGRRVSVAGDWTGQGATGEEGAGFLRAVRDGACRVFSTVLTPDYNAAHADHLHLDAAPFRLCVRDRSPAARIESG